MNRRLSWPIFWALVAVFIVIVSVFLTMALLPPFEGLLQGLPLLLFITSSGSVFLLLGVALIFFTVKEKVEGSLKKFLLTTGASATGFFVSILLHNFIYGLFIHFLGADFWNEGDEPFFFIIAVIVCPIGFLVGAIGSVVLAMKRPSTPS